MANETTITSIGGVQYRVSGATLDGAPHVYVVLGSHIPAFAKPEAIRFAKALLEAVDEPYTIGTKLLHHEQGQRDRPATLGDVDRILAAIREGDEAPPPMDSTEGWLDPGIDPRPSNFWGVLAWRAAHKKARREIDSLRLSIAKRDRDEKALEMHRTAEYRRMQDQVTAAGRAATDAITERDQARQQRDEYKRGVGAIERRALKAIDERDAARAERDEIGHRLRAENDKFIDRLSEPNRSGVAHTMSFVPNATEWVAFPSGRWTVKDARVSILGGVALDMEPYRD